LPAKSPTGAQATVVRIERNANEYRYYLELSDPGYIDGILELDEPLYYPLQEKKIDSGGAIAGGYAVAASEISPSYKPMPPEELKSEGLKGGRRLYLKKR
jgi:hypothetical protein